MEKRQLQFGITKERKMLSKKRKGLKMPETDLCANISAFETEELYKKFDGVLRKNDFRGLVSLKNGFLNVRMDDEFLFEKMAQRASQAPSCGRKTCETSFFEEYAVLRADTLSEIIEKQGISCNDDIDGDFLRTAALIVCEKEIFEELSKLRDPLLKILGVEEITFSAIKEPEKAVAMLFFEGDRQRSNLKEVKPTLYRGISAFLKG